MGLLKYSITLFKKKFPSYSEVVFGDPLAIMPVEARIIRLECALRDVHNILSNDMIRLADKNSKLKHHVEMLDQAIGEIQFDLATTNPKSIYANLERTLN